MSNDYTDPSANTQAFQAWVEKQGTEPAAPARNLVPYIVAGVVAALVVVAAVVFLAVR